MKPEQLPDSFEVYTSFTLEGQEWSVIEADPVHSKDFTLSKSLKLKLLKVEKINPQDILLTLPTISNEIPDISETSRFNDFCTTFHEDHWRQREFLNSSSFPIVEIEVKAIKEIWKNHNRKIDENFNAFDKLHVRDTIGLPNLNIDFNKLQEFLGVNKIGSAFIDRLGFAKNGFSLETENTVYAGIVLEDEVKELCILTFNENSVNEVEAINRLFNLIHVDWYNYTIIADND